MKNLLHFIIWFICETFFSPQFHIAPTAHFFLFSFSANSHYSEFKCNSVCIGCEHGICIAPNLCECSDGYQWESNVNKCIPICATNCTNGICMAQDNCTCNENYYFNETLESCEPNCPSGCTFGICIAPNECACNVGYQLKNGSLNECQPICEPNCKNGKCISNECVCNKGYHFKSLNECEPKCEPQCENGDCTSPNYCKCRDGYRLGNGSFHECTPICSSECDQYGHCIQPNLCECNNGYEKSNNSNNASIICCPICNSPEDCTNGMCITSGICNCFAWFRLNHTDNYKSTVELEDTLIEAIEDNRTTSDW